MKYEIIPFQKEHWYLLRFKDDKIEALTGLPDAEHARILAAGGPSYSAFADDKIIAIGGVFLLWPGTGEAWCLVSPEIRKHGVFFTRATMRYLDMIAKMKSLKRIQAVVQEDFEVGKRWMRGLVFINEGRMIKYFNGKTFIRYAKIYP